MVGRHWICAERCSVKLCQTVPWLHLGHSQPSTAKLCGAKLYQTMPNC